MSLCEWSVPSLVRGIAEIEITLQEHKEDPLRKRIIEDMELGHLVPSTKRVHGRMVEEFAPS